jgi:uncharacterized protein
VTKIILCMVALVALATAPSAGGAERRRSVDPYIFAASVIRSAENGNVNAEAQLGWMYSTGRGVPQNFYKAAKWYYLAAVQGHAEAQFQLGLMYNKGIGVPQDYVLSYLWLNLSASQAVGDDRDFKARMRDAVATKMTVLQVAMAQKMALAWYKTR